MSNGLKAGQCLFWLCGRLRARKGQNLVFQAGDRPVGDAAGIDERKVTQIGGDVEGESVRRDATGNMNPDSADLPPCQRFTLCATLARGIAAGRKSAAPDTGEAADAPCKNAKHTADPDQRLLH